MDDANNHLAPIRAMVEVLDPGSREALARALHQHVHAPRSPVERRLAELGPLARLLDEQPQPPERLPYIQRKAYDQRRAQRGAGPSSEWLTDRYGSWQRACWAAWTLLRDGRKPLGGPPYPRHHPNGKRPVTYTADECIVSVQACAAALGHPPSSSEYHRWSIERKRQAREAGQELRIARMSIVLRALAPEDAPPREKWLTARTRALAAADEIRGYARESPLPMS